METPRTARRAFGRVKDGRGNLLDVHNSAPSNQFHTSMVGEVVFGWSAGTRCLSPRTLDAGPLRDVDAAGLFGGAAGARLGRNEEKVKSKRRCHLGLSSTVDTLIHGRDTDNSGECPHTRFMEQFDEHAGLRSGEKVLQEVRMSGKKPGFSLSKLAVVDTVVFGRDMDTSGEDPHERSMSKFGDHAGMRSREVKLRLAKPGLRAKSTVDTLLYGRDIDGSGEAEAHGKQMLEKNVGAAGVRSGERNRGRKGNVQALTNVESVVFNKEAEVVEQQDFASAFSGYAGVKSGSSVMKRMSSCPGGFLTARSSQEALTAPSSHGGGVWDLEESPLREPDLACHELPAPRGEAFGQPPPPPREEEARQPDPPPRTPPPLTPPQTPSQAGEVPAVQGMPAPLSPMPMSPTTGHQFPQRVNPFGGRRSSSTSSVCSSASHASQVRTARGPDRRICFDECGSMSSRGSLRPQWRR